MFVWKISSIMDNFNKFLPEMDEGLQNIKDAVGTDKFDEVLYDSFDSFNSDSIDFAIMEKADDIFTIPGSFGWDDVGSWLALERINQTDENGNYISGDVVSIGTERSIVSGGKRLIAMVGVEDIIVVDTDDAILICSKDNTQDVKKVIENLRICNRRELI